MKSESLSQDEIDLLFSGGGEAPAVAEDRPTPDTQIYDFRRPARISKDRQRSLEAIYSLLAKSLEGWLTGRVRDQIVLDVQSVEELTYGEFILALPSPCASFIFDVRNAGGCQGIIDFGQELSYFVVDRILGGSAKPAIMDRSLSPTERLVVRIVAERVAGQLADVWRDYINMDLAISGFETIPEMLNIANREDPVLVSNIAVSASGLDSSLLLCLPFSLLEGFFSTSTNRRLQGAQGSMDERDRERKSIEQMVRGAKVSVAARFPPFRVPLGTLASLRPGSLLKTTSSPGSELMVFLSGQERFRGSPGRIGKKLAIQITAPVPPDS